MASLADSATFWSLLVFKSPVLFKKSVSDNVDLIFYPSLSSGLRSLQCRNLVCPLAPSLLPLKHSSHLRVMQESKRRDYSGHCSSSDNTLRGGGGRQKLSLFGGTWLFSLHEPQTHSPRHRSLTRETWLQTLVFCPSQTSPPPEIQPTISSFWVGCPQLAISLLSGIPEKRLTLPCPSSPLVPYPGRKWKISTHSC